MASRWATIWVAGLILAATGSGAGAATPDGDPAPIDGPELRAPDVPIARAGALALNRTGGSRVPLIGDPESPPAPMAEVPAPRSPGVDLPEISGMGPLIILLTGLVGLAARRRLLKSLHPQV